MADNWFTSLRLVRRLLQKDTTYVGTIKTNRRELPSQAKKTAQRVPGDTKFLYNMEGSTILVSFWDKGTKPVLLLDTFICSGEMDEQSGKAASVVHHSVNKSGVDVMNKMIRHYSSKRKCNRWPVSFFFNLVDICLSNTCIFMAKLLDVAGRERKAFHLKTIKDVGYAMVERHIRGRMASHAIPPLSLSEN